MADLGSTFKELIDEINSKGSGTIDSINGLKGGMLLSPLIVSGGDGANASKIALKNTDKGQITDGSTGTLFGFMSSNVLTVGHNNYETNIRGNSNSSIGGKKFSDLAVKSDISEVKAAVAGKAKSYVISYNDLFTNGRTGAKWYDKDGNDITGNLANYDNSKCVNTMFKNTSLNPLDSSITGYYLIVRTFPDGAYTASGYNYTVYSIDTGGGLNVGDNVYVIENSVPDRWYAGNHTFYALEGKPLANYATLSGSNTFTGSNTFKEKISVTNSQFAPTAYGYDGITLSDGKKILLPAKAGTLALDGDIPTKVEETLTGYLTDDTVNQVIYWDADNGEFTSRDVAELETNVVGNPASGEAVGALTRIQIGDKVYSVIAVTDYCVKLTGDQSVSGVKTFNAPTNISGSETTTTKFKTSNGGSIRIGKEGANSGTMLRFDQVDGTCRLRFRGSATAGAMVWEQPEKNAALYFDMGNSAGSGVNRVTLRNVAGTLALTKELPAAVSANPTLSGSETELTGLQIGSTKYKMPSGGSSGGVTVYLHALSLRCTMSGDNDNWYDMVVGVYSTQSAKITTSNISNYKFNNLMFSCAKVGKTSLLTTDMFVGYIGMLMMGTSVIGYNVTAAKSFMLSVSSVSNDNVYAI